MHRQLRISHQARADIKEVLARTLTQFGERKYEQYLELIRMALHEIAANPEHRRAKRRPEIHERARTFHIARHGQRARHFFLFRAAEDGTVEIGRFLYDGMELARHLPKAYGPEDDPAERGE